MLLYIFPFFIFFDFPKVFIVFLRLCVPSPQSGALYPNKTYRVYQTLIHRWKLRIWKIYWHSHSPIHMWSEDIYLYRDTFVCFFSSDEKMTADEWQRRRCDEGEQLEAGSNQICLINETLLLIRADILFLFWRGLFIYSSLDLHYEPQTHQDDSNRQ